jgi:hypothetical protein
MMRGALFLVLLLLATGLAGCIGDRGDGDETPTTPDVLLPRLADFAECDFTYPDNTTVPCADQFTNVEVTVTAEPEPAEGWICIHDGTANSDTDTNHNLYWNPTTDRLGIYYWSNGVSLPLSGYIVVDGQEPIVWRGTGESGFIDLYPHPGEFTTTPWPRNLWYEFRLYTHAFESNGTALEGAQIKALWSLYNGLPYPLQALETSNGTYYFDEVQPVPLGDGEWYAVKPFEIQGEDFDLRVLTATLIDRRTQANLLPSPTC